MRKFNNWENVKAAGDFVERYRQVDMSQKLWMQKK